MSSQRPAEAQFFARLSQELMHEAGRTGTVQGVAERAVEVVGPCDWCGITERRRRGRLESIAASSEVAQRCDQLQAELEQGPSMETARLQDFHLAQDLAGDQRWPLWASRVVELGVGSVLSIRLTTGTEVLGALTLYSGGREVWTPDDVDVALIYAAHAANALSSARLASGLRSAMDSRHLIGVAQGLLMVRYEMTLEQTFEVLRRLSSDHNIKLRQLAGQVVEERGIPAALLREPGRDGRATRREPLEAAED